eukprot:m.275438 g.275438  ORF g.275438 m.275438 type:complete len:279 (-) comp22863_c1_seq3:661-1497(-)
MEMALSFLELCGVPVPANRSSCHYQVRSSFLHLASAGALFTPLVASVRAAYLTTAHATPEETQALLSKQGRLGLSADAWGAVVDAHCVGGDDPAGAACSPLWIRLHEQDVLLQGGLAGWVLRRPGLLTADRRAFARLALQQLCDALPESPHLVYLSVCFEAGFNVKAAKKLAKSQLKKPNNRSNLALLDCYARLEHHLGNMEDARKVLHTAIRMASSSPADSAAGLCVTLLELEIAHAAGCPGSRHVCPGRHSRRYQRRALSPTHPGPGWCGCCPACV